MHCLEAQALLVAQSQSSVCCIIGMLVAQHWWALQSHPIILLALCLPGVPMHPSVCGTHAESHVTANLEDVLIAAAAAVDARGVLLLGLHADGVPGVGKTQVG